MCAKGVYRLKQSSHLTIINLYLDYNKCSMTTVTYWHNNSKKVWHWATFVQIASILFPTFTSKLYLTYIGLQGIFQNIFCTFFNLPKTVKSSSFAGQIMTKFFNNKYDCLLSNFSLNLGHKPIHKLNYKREASILFSWPMIGQYDVIFV